MKFKPMMIDSGTIQNTKVMMVDLPFTYGIKAMKFLDHTASGQLKTT